MHERPIAQTDITSTDVDEMKLAEVAKHPFGIIIMYIQSLVGVTLGLGLAFFLLPSILEDTETAFTLAGVFAVFVVMAAVVIIMFATIIYRQNRLIITDRNITQILQTGLFSKKVSQLNLVNVEDVTSLQKGFFATMVGYGTLKIETAGEQANFEFTYCPRSGYYAKIILNAREKILGQHDGDATLEPGFTTTR